MNFTVDELANEIRRVDGNHDMGAGQLAEHLHAWMEKSHTPPEVDTEVEDMVDTLIRRQLDRRSWYHDPDSTGRGSYPANQEVEDLRTETIRQLSLFKAKAEYAESMGIQFGMARSSDRPEPYLAHVWSEDSDHERMFRDWTRSITAVAMLKRTLREKLPELFEGVALWGLAHGQGIPAGRWQRAADYGKEVTDSIEELKPQEGD